jgi:hypothetical protein
MKQALRYAIILGLVTAFALALVSATASARSYGYRHHHYGHHWFGNGILTRARLVQTLGN